MPKKVLVTVRNVDLELWDKFKILCIKRRTNATRELKRLIEKEVRESTE